MVCAYHPQGGQDFAAAQPVVSSRGAGTATKNPSRFARYFFFIIYKKI
jgi:hypothetical protein